MWFRMLFHNWGLQEYESFSYFALNKSIYFTQVQWWAALLNHLPHVPLQRMDKLCTWSTLTWKWMKINYIGVNSAKIKSWFNELSNSTNSFVLVNNSYFSSPNSASVVGLTRHHHCFCQFLNRHRVSDTSESWPTLNLDPMQFSKLKFL